MKQKVSAIGMVLVMLLTLSVSAAPRYNGAKSCKANLKFRGTTAVCSVQVIGNNGDDIDATLILYDKDGNEVMSWSDLSGTAKLNFTGQVNVVSGQTYKLTANATVGGESLSGNSSLTCP